MDTVILVLHEWILLSNNLLNLKIVYKVNSVVSKASSKNMNTKEIRPIRLAVINFLLVIFICTSTIAQPTKQSYLLALSKGDRTLAIVNHPL